MAGLPIHIDWVAPAGCPSREEILGVIERTVGASVVGTPVDARVIVTQNEREFRAQVKVSAAGATSTRSVDGESCRAVGDAAAFIVALAANPDARPPTPPPTAPPAATPARSIEHAAGAPMSLAGRPLFLAASLITETGSLPSVGFGGELALGWTGARLHLEVVGAFLAPQRAALATTPSEGANLWFAHVGARACYELLGTRIDVGPCLGGGVEWIPASGFGSPPDQTANATGIMVVGSFGARAIARVSSRFVVRLVLETLVPSVRPTFAIDGGGEIFQTSAVFFATTAGAETYF